MITSTEQRIRASRANGARSRGPRTPEGKARSSQNAIQHGLLSRTLLLSGESEDGLHQAVDGFMERFAPTDEVECGLVQEMVAATWRMRRAWAIETRLIDSSIQDDPASDDLGRITRAFTKLAAGPELPLLFRYQGRLQHEYQRALRNLLSLRRNHPPTRPVCQTNLEPLSFQQDRPPNPKQQPTSRQTSTPQTPDPPEPNLVGLLYQTNLDVLYFQQDGPEPDQLPHT